MTYQDPTTRVSAREPFARPPGTARRRPRWWLIAVELIVVAVVAVVVIVSVGSSPSHKRPGGDPAAVRGRLGWNAPVPATAPLAPHSSGATSTARAPGARPPSRGSTPALQRPRVHGRTTPGPACRSRSTSPIPEASTSWPAFAAGVPIPAGARAAEGTDSRSWSASPATTDSGSSGGRTRPTANGTPCGAADEPRLRQPRLLRRPARLGRLGDQPALLGGLMRISELKRGSHRPRARAGHPGGGQDTSSTPPSATTATTPVPTRSPRARGSA